MFCRYTAVSDHILSLNVARENCNDLTSGEPQVAVDNAKPATTRLVLIPFCVTFSIRGLPKTELIFGTCDPYVTVHLGPMKLLRTENKHTRNPDYDYTWADFVCAKADKLIFKIKDLDVDGSQVSDHLWAIYSKHGQSQHLPSPLLQRLIINALLRLQHIGDCEIDASVALKGERLQGSFPIILKPRWAKKGVY